MITKNRNVRFKSFTRSRPKTTVPKIKKEFFILALFKKRALKAEDIARLTRQFATMLSSGISLIQSFEIILRGSKHATLNNLILSIKTDLKSNQ